MSKIVPSGISIRRTPVRNAIKHHTSILAHKSLSLEHLLSLWRAHFLQSMYNFNNISCLFCLQSSEIEIISMLDHDRSSELCVSVVRWCNRKVQVLKLSYLLASAILHTTSLEKTFIKGQIKPKADLRAVDSP